PSLCISPQKEVTGVTSGVSLLSFCTACSIHGVQTRECGHTSRSPLDPLETAIGFHMRDWWQPTKANFF
ncbi:hypothetical protein FSI24_028340, partial [Escherichia coli]|nr:hypothetical protein [Escherichia coli]